MKVLVIEDDASVRETLGMVLDALGHQAELVPDGECTLASLEREWPDVMLLDLTLPGLTGEEVYSAIRQRFGRVPPTIVLSAVQQGEKRMRNLPGAAFLAKPYTMEELDEMLYSAVGKAA